MLVGEKTVYPSLQDFETVSYSKLSGHDVTSLTLRHRQVEHPPIHLLLIRDMNIYIVPAILLLFPFPTHTHTHKKLGGVSVLGKKRENFSWNMHMHV